MDITPKVWQPPNNLELQVFDGLFETDSCWDFSGVAIMEIVLTNLFPTFPAIAQTFFISNGYCDANGNFALSRRYIAVLSGVKNYGNYQLDFWTLVSKYGIIPRTVLDFTPTSSQDPNYPAFVADFFNPLSVTPLMKTLGEQFLLYVNVSAVNVNPALYMQFVAKTPVQLGIPVPQNVATWNQVTVPYDGTVPISHAVVGMGGTLSSIAILDSYTPWTKYLTNGYEIGILTVPTITVRNLGQIQVPLTVYQQFIALLKSIGISWGK